MAGPLAGVKVVEMVGIGPGPFCAMMLADMGAEVIRIDQPRRGPLPDPYSALNTRFDVQARNRRSIAVNLKTAEGVATVLSLVTQADALIEGFRPGVMERLGLGPDICLERNPRLVYGRMTGWGQDGPLAHVAGHDINYIALSGVLAALGDPYHPPAPPLNLVGDLGGGGMLLAFGLVCALLEARRSGQGQVVDAAMTDGSALLMSMFYGLRAAGQWQDQRGVNLLDGGAHFYGSFTCADGRHVAIGPLEPPFYKQLLDLCGLSDPALQMQMDPTQWPQLRATLAEVFRTRTRDDWCRLLEGTDACFAPVLQMEEAPHHPHNVARKTFIEVDGVIQPAPAPRFSRTPSITPTRPPSVGEHSREILRDWGFGADAVDALFNIGSVC
ncbi:CaiB/BaiF CoA transferase family protein [Paraburkholderia xenovorans]|uniref:CaiB/BaiF CoA transferase family protein n=1 Tax=Paraburkholderia xenovorans TaxID=36873 RepID=UPI00155925F7|nr:CaiB/BaiF CoA-transferase family protein [Paraburkholderia xenovorans]NPT39206.1 CoA transferase [Paraburkholderia xenovorans]